MNGNLLEIKHISKYINDAAILDDISFCCRSGEIFAITGENASGKSALVRVLTGLTDMTSESIVIDGSVVYPSIKCRRREHFIAAVQQGTYLFKNLNVIDNVFLENYSRHLPGFINSRKTRQRFEEMIEFTQFPLEPDTKVSKLDYAKKRMVEVLKVLALDPSVLIFDGLIGNFSKEDSELFFECLRKLKRQGKIIIYVTHVIQEALYISDRLSVISNGSIIYSSLTEHASKSNVIKLMSSVQSKNRYPRLPHEKGPAVMHCVELCTGKIQNITFSLYRGEVLGITGLVGSGKSSIARVLAGVERPRSGSIYVNDEKVTLSSPNTAHRCGIGHIVGTHYKDLVPDFLPEKNITLTSLKKVSRFGFIRETGKHPRG